MRHPKKKSPACLSAASLPAGIVLLVVLLLITACSSMLPKKAVPLAGQGEPEPPPPSLASALPNYAIQPGDELEIKFFYNPELNDTVKVRPDGRISLQLVDEVQAASLTTGELAAVLEKKYGARIKEPEIGVIVRSFDSRKVFVDGEVARPGMVGMGGSMSIMQAIAAAGGLRNTARSDEILVIRHNGLNKPFIMRIDLAAAMEGTDITQNISLESRDIIYVPKSAIANVNSFVDLYIRKNIPIGLGYGFYHTVE